MIIKAVCIGLGILIGAVIVMVYSCCKVSGDISRKMERWVDSD